MKKHFIPFYLIAFCVVMVACTKANEEELRGPVSSQPTCDTVNMKLAANIVPILRTNCYSCHGNGLANGGVQLDVYSSLRIWATSGTIVGAITHSAGYSPMPQGGAKLSDCDINKIKNWISRGALNN